MTALHPSLAAGFSGVESWVFDLDNTLYPAETDLFGQIDVRIRAYLAQVLGIDPAEAGKVQKDYYLRFGTTLRGLMDLHHVDAADFLDYVHDIDHSVVPPDPRLAAALDRLPGPKYVFTNGSVRHAEKTLAALGLEGRFTGIFDVVAAGYSPKPRPEAYERFFAATGIVAGRSAMFEDLSRNLAVPHALGMRTVLVVPRAGAHDFRDALDLEGRASPHVEHVADDLAGFIDEVATALGAAATMTRGADEPCPDGSGRGRRSPL
jgi:putative hydrolase of the HAD superfamily